MSAFRKGLATALVLLAGAALTPFSISAADLHLILNVNGDEDHYPQDAGKTIQEALDGMKPAAIDSSADGYFVQLAEGSTIEALGLRVKGEKPAEDETGGVEEVVAEAAASGGSEDKGETGWIELEAYSAAVYYWSETGEGESEWGREPPRFFSRRLAGGEVVVWITGEQGDEPPGDEHSGSGR